METAARYEKFASSEAHGESACYEEWAAGVAGDPTLIAMIDELPAPRRQPNLLFAAARYAGIGPGSYASFRTALLAAWPQVSQIMTTHRTQTNEPGRCAVLLPLLAALSSLAPQPLALLEVGASAGLCLYPDRFSYQYSGQARLDPPDRPGAAVLDCAITGPVPIPAALPLVVWRAGVDLNPLCVDDREQMSWLDALIWPEHDARRRRLAAAIEVARSDPPRLVRGDLNDKVSELASQAPGHATLVIFHSAVLAYLDPAERSTFTINIGKMPGHWISNEGTGVVTFEAGALPAPPDPARAAFVLALDGRPVAYTGPHGQSLHWFG